MPSHEHALARADPQGVSAPSYSRARVGGATSRYAVYGHLAMKYSLRKTPSHLHLAYKYAEAGDSLMGRDFVLEVEGRELTLTIDLTSNFHTRNKGASAYLDAVNLAQNHHKLRYLQCSDNLVRARLIKAWELVQQPQLRMCLDLGQRGRYIYAVQPHSLFTGGIQFDVQEGLEPEALRASRGSMPEALETPGNHA